MSYKYSITSKVNKLLEDEEKEEQTKANESNDTQEKTAKATTKTANIEQNTDKNKNSDLKSKTANEIILDLKNIQNKYEKNDYVDAPDSLGLEKVDVPNKTEEELTAIAKASLDKKYNDKKISTNQSFSKQIENILASKENSRKNAQNKKEQITNIYDQGIKETENQMLKRGLARSSIVIGEISELEGSKANELANVLNTLQNELSTAENSLAELETQHELALKNLDIEYALELEQEIETVTNDYQKARKEAIDFNNDILKLEAEYKLDLDKQKLDKQIENTKMKDEYGMNYTYKLIKEEQFNYLKQYFDSLEPDYAFNLLLTNKEFKSILGDRYSDMYQYLKSK